MANIMDVDFRQIPGKANQIQQLGLQLNAELTSAWNSVDELRASWHGLRYNELISYFNKTTETLNKMVKLAVNEIPEALGTVATNYARAEGTSVAAVSPASVTAIQTLADSDTSTMAYTSSEAANVRTLVNNNFSKAEGYVNEIETTFASITWESEAKNAFQQRLSSLKSQMIDAITNINTQFTKLMQASQADIEGAESANTID